MNPKLIIALVATGLIFFATMYFRTGDPEIPGLERPNIKLGSFTAGMEKGGTGPVNKAMGSRFKKEPIKSNANRAKMENRTNKRKSAGNTTKITKNKNRTRAKTPGKIKKRAGVGTNPRSKADFLKDRRRRLDERRKNPQVADNPYLGGEEGELVDENVPEEDFQPQEEEMMEQPMDEELPPDMGEGIE